MARQAPPAERLASAQFHAGLITGALAVHGAQLESPVETGAGLAVVLVGQTRTGLPLEITVEVHGA